MLTHGRSYVLGELSMLKRNEFERWIDATHTLFEIFEGRYDVYPVTVTWINEWLGSGFFKITKEHITRIFALIENFDYEVYGVKGEQKERIDAQFKNLLQNHLREGRSENAGFAIAPYLFTWNFQRFKKYYFKMHDFDVSQYFQALSDFIKEQKKDLEFFKNKRLMQEQIETEKIKQLFNKINVKLGVLSLGHNEPVATVKIMHVFAPYYFPLIDNSIAEKVGLLTYEWETLTANSYLIWMKAVKNWLINYKEIIDKIEQRYSSSILKLVDEGLYMMSTVDLSKRVADLGVKIWPLKTPK